MSKRVQINVYGVATGPETDDFFAKLSRQFKALEIDLLIERSPGTNANLHLILVDGAAWTAAEELHFEALINAGQAVLPVIDSASDARFLPKATAGINAFKKSDGRFWSDRLVDECLSLAWLQRRTRKIFISYKRTDSAAIARQLFAHFQLQGYQVFLDDASIDRGMEFQQELLWWLNDADLLLALGSPNFAASKWCQEEISFAQHQLIGIVVLNWPRHSGSPAPPVPLKATMPDQQLHLKSSDFRWWTPRAGLTRAALARVEALCARNRARAIAGRLNELLPIVRAELVKQGAQSITQTFGDVAYLDKSGHQCFVRVLPFRPGPEQIHQAYGVYTGIGLSACAYPEFSPTDQRSEALHWLAAKNQPYPIQGLRSNVLWRVFGKTVT